MWHRGKPPASPRNVEAFAPFAIGTQHTGYEWLLVYAGRDPNHPFFRAIAEGPEDFDNRAKVLLTLTPDAYRNLLRSIDRGRIEPTVWAYPQNKRGETEPDAPQSVFCRKAMLDFFSRIGGYGPRISELLALGQAESCAATAPDAPGTTVTADGSRRSPDLCDEPPPLAEPDPIDRLAGWIYGQHSKNPPTFKTLYTAATAKLNQLKKADLQKAFQRVYATRPWHPPATGWPLRSPHKDRWEQEKQLKESHESLFSRET